MIEVNLIPDVKQEFIRAQRARNLVISLSIVVAIAFAAVVTLMALYVFGVQAVRSSSADSEISKQAKTLQNVPDLSKALTLQNQLAAISNKHDSTTVDSRMFDLISTVVQSGNTNVTISNFEINTDTTTITLEGESTSGYSAFDAFKKTILASKFQFQQKDSSQTQSVKLTDQVNDGDRSYGQDASGRPSLRFSVSFTYPEELFSRSSTSGQFVAPKKTNATDSALEVPTSIFTGSGGNK